MIKERWVWVRAAAQSEFGRNAIWFTALNACERLIAVMQTVLIARALGITEYGVYGLLFGTIGFVGSVLGLQMGLTATVYLARYRLAEKAKAAAVIAITTKFGWLVAVLFVAAAAPFSESFSRALFGVSSYALPVVLGIAFIGVAIVSGVQDGIAQGFELFVPMARIKIIVALLTMVAIYPMAIYFGLAGVLVAILCSVAIKYRFLQTAVSLCRARDEIPREGTGVTFHLLVMGFSLPSMAISLGVGFATWFGLYLLSRGPAGFDEVAIVNTGLQWRGPVTLIASALGGVAIPMFSRLTSANEAAAASSLRHRLMLINLAIALLAVIALLIASGPIMRLYGDRFEEGQLAFAVIAISTVPAILANVYQQEMVGAGRMWRQVWIHVPFLIMLVGGFVLLIPEYRANGYAIVLVIGSLVLLTLYYVADAIGGHGSSQPRVMRP